MRHVAQLLYSGFNGSGDIFDWTQEPKNGEEMGWLELRSEHGALRLAIDL